MIRIDVTLVEYPVLLAGKSLRVRAPAHGVGAGVTTVRGVVEGNVGSVLAFATLGGEKDEAPTPAPVGR